jgi:mannose-6-phosphate isomerase-like protein (cupin superfamily)
MEQTSSPILVRHEGEAPSERSACGWRRLLISRQDRGQNVAAWVHTVDIDGVRDHYHKIGAEIYYVLEGQGSVVLDGVEHPLYKGSVVYVPPGVIHGARGRMRVLVIGIPDISPEDQFFPPDSADAPIGR